MSADRGNYQVFLIKISGESLAGPNSGSVDAEVLAVHNTGAQLALDFGGGDSFRDIRSTGLPLDRVAADQLCTLATVTNLIVFGQWGIRKNLPTMIMSAAQIEGVCLKLDKIEARTRQSPELIVGLGGGTGDHTSVAIRPRVCER